MKLTKCQSIESRNLEPESRNIAKMRATIEIPNLS